MPACLMVLLALARLVGFANGITITEDEYLGSGLTGESATGILLTLLLIRLRRRRRLNGTLNTPRRYWVRPTNSRRVEQGYWGNLVQEMMQQEEDQFLNFHRMTIDQFIDLLSRIEPIIERSRVVREPIPPGLKLSLTLRFLADGGSMVSLAYAYRIGKSTTSAIIRETCLAIWQVLQPEVLRPPTREEWQSIANDFGRLWNFPNCVGAIDGKHVVVQCFNKTGSEFHNYKGSFSTSLLAVADAQYRFIFVSIGSKGRESDGGIFQTCPFGQAITWERLPLPEPLQIRGFPIPLPPVFLGDQAFPLLPQLMRPYTSTTRPQPVHRIFNYRHCRARRVVENAFGILSTRFRIFRRPIVASAETVDAIVQATVVLHNWLRNHDLRSSDGQYMPNALVDQENDDGTVRQGTWRQEPAPTGLIPHHATPHVRNPAVRAKTIRDNLATYFMSAPGQVPWQWQHLPDFQRPS